MIWTHKTAPTIEIKPMPQAIQFARLQKRFGVGPLRAIVQQKEPSTKQGSGAEAGAQYLSNLCEKRTVKR